MAKQPTDGLREALEFLNRFSGLADENSREMPFFCATNALLMEIARRERVSVQAVLESVQVNA